MAITPTLHLLATGGTIAGVADAHAAAGYRAAALDIDALLASVPALRQLPARLQARQIVQKDSKDMDAADWLTIAHAVRQAQSDACCAGVVITHGTDTLEETAWFLHRTLPPCEVPVILTSSMRAATTLGADGPGNLLDACIAALSGLSGCPGPRLQGVFSVAAATIDHAMHVRKVQPWHIPAFDSGQAGAVGWIEAGRVRLAWPGAAGGHTLIDPLDEHALLYQPGQHQALLAVPAGQALAALPAVACISSHAGFDARHIHALCAAGFDGLLIAATGNGTLHHALEAALQSLPSGASRPAIALTSRTQGRMVGSPGPWPCIPLPAPKARLELLLQLWGKRLQNTNQYEFNLNVDVPK